MIKHVEPEVFCIDTDETCLETTDKKLALIAFEYQKGKTDQAMLEIAGEISDAWNEDIKRLKKEIKEDAK